MDLDAISGNDIQSSALALALPTRKEASTPSNLRPTTMDVTPLRTAPPNVDVTPLCTAPPNVDVRPCKRPRTTKGSQKADYIIKSKSPLFQVEVNGIETMNILACSKWYVEVCKSGKNVDLGFFYKESSMAKFKRFGVVISVMCPTDDSIILIVKECRLRKAMQTDPLFVKEYSFNSMEKKLKGEGMTCLSLGWNVEDSTAKGLAGLLSSNDLGIAISRVREQLFNKGNYASSILKNAKFNALVHSPRATCKEGGENTKAGTDVDVDIIMEDCVDEGIGKAGQGRSTYRFSPEEQAKIVQESTKRMESFQRYYPLGLQHTVNIDISRLVLCTGKAVLYNHRVYNDGHMESIYNSMLKLPCRNPSPADVLPFDARTGEPLKWKKVQDLNDPNVKFYVIEGQHSVRAAQEIIANNALPPELSVLHKKRMCRVLHGDTPDIQLSMISHAQNSINELFKYESPYTDQVSHARAQWIALGRPPRPVTCSSKDTVWQRFEDFCKYTIIEKPKQSDGSSKSFPRMTEHYDLIMCPDQVWENWTRIWEAWKGLKLLDSKGKPLASPAPDIFVGTYMRPFQGLGMKDMLEIQSKILNGEVLLRKHSSKAFGKGKPSGVDKTTLGMKDVKEYAKQLKLARAMEDGIVKFCTDISIHRGDYEFFKQKCNITDGDMKNLLVWSSQYLDSATRKNLKTTDLPVRVKDFLKERLGFPVVKFDPVTNEKSYLISIGSKGYCGDALTNAPISLFVLNLMEEDMDHFDDHDLQQFWKSCRQMTTLDKYTIVIFVRMGIQSANVIQSAEGIVGGKKVIYGFYEHSEQSAERVPATAPFSIVVTVMISKNETPAITCWPHSFKFQQLLMRVQDNLPDWKDVPFMEENPTLDNVCLGEGAVSKKHIRSRVVKYLISSFCIEENSMVCEWYMHGTFGQGALCLGKKVVSIVRSTFMEEFCQKYFDSVEYFAKTSKNKIREVSHDDEEEENHTSNNSEHSAATQGDNENEQSISKTNENQDDVQPLEISPCEEPMEHRRPGDLHVNGTKTSSHVVAPEEAEEDVLSSQPELDGKLVHSLNNRPRKLLILDISGVLASVVTKQRASTIRTLQKPIISDVKHIYPRPRIQEFFGFCFERFDVAVWSTATYRRIKSTLKDMGLKHHAHKFSFTWSQNDCMCVTDLPSDVSEGKPIFLKKLESVYQQFGGKYHEGNTILFDASPYKCYMNTRNSIFVKLYHPEEYETDDYFFNDIVPLLMELEECEAVAPIIDRHPEFKQIDNLNANVMKALDKLFHGL